MSETQTQAAHSPFMDIPISQMFGSEVVSLDPGVCDAIREDDPRASRPLLDMFIENIHVNGQLHPGLVYPKGDGRFAVIAGLQRLRAIRELNRKGANLKFKVLVADTRLASLSQMVAATASNEAVMPTTVLERAYFLTNLLQDCNYNNSEVARRAGVDEGTVRNARLLVEKGSAALTQAVREGLLSETAAVQIIKDNKDNTAAQIKKVEEIKKKAEEKKAQGEKTKVTASEITNARPSLATIKKYIITKNIPTAIAAVLQWVVGEIATPEFAASTEWFRKSTIEIEEAEKSISAQEEKVKRENAEKAAQKKAEREAAKAKKAAEKAAWDSLPEEEKKRIQAQRQLEKAQKALEKYQNQNPNASAKALAEKAKSSGAKPPQKKKA